MVPCPLALRRIAKNSSRCRLGWRVALEFGERCRLRLLSRLPRSSRTRTTFRELAVCASLASRSNAHLDSEFRKGEGGFPRSRWASCPPRNFFFLLLPFCPPVNELMTMLRNALATRDPVKQKEAIQKVIGECKDVARWFFVAERVLRVLPWALVVSRAGQRGPHCRGTRRDEWPGEPRSDVAMFQELLRGFFSDALM
jgi:hypothetical protein